jgi:hypothetical protein
MVKRSVGMALIVAMLVVGGMSAMLVVGGVSGTAHAADGPRIEYDEIRANATDAGAEFLPEEFEIPGFFDWLIIPLIAGGVVVTIAILGRYLVSQPRFAREAEERERR